MKFAKGFGILAVAVTYFGVGVVAAPFISKSIHSESSFKQIWEPFYQKEVVEQVVENVVFRPTPKPEVVYLNDEVKHDEDLYCLAHNIYLEARGEGVEGQIAVGYVTMNRVKTSSHGWPDSVCGVVFQRKAFSWTLDKPYIDLSKETERRAYARAVRVAAGVLSGRWEDKTEGATHYYAIKRMKDKKEPWWADSYTEVAVVGGHTFLK